LVIRTCGYKHKEGVQDYPRTGNKCWNKENYKQVADVPGFSTGWYDKTAIANIFGLSDLKKKRRITFDSEKEDAFIVHTNDGNMKFKCNPEGLYTFEVSNRYLKKESHLINTVKENRGCHIPHTTLQDQVQEHQSPPIHQTKMGA
jgi:hypothetical protein